ncbi:DUF1697 domain-containing protein [Virgibacillus oceani]
MVYVALLRGINVGGKNKIDMKLLQKTFERAGMKSVVTYINSGNIIFTQDSLSKLEVSHILEEAIQKDFGLQIKVLIRTFDEFKIIMNSLPESWKNDQHMKSGVMFLWDEIDDKSVIDKLQIKPGIDYVKYVTGAILWSVDKENAAKSGKIKLVGTDLYKKMTIRNVNTTRKIYKLMQKTVSG